MNTPLHATRPLEDCPILIVEDSPTQLEHLQDVLDRGGHRFASARNGNEALSRIEEHPPVLVISDVMMPGMGGYELCARIKQEPRWQSIRVILLTSLSDPVDVLKGLECGADDFLFKPFDESRLMSRVTRFLNEPASAPGVEVSDPVDLVFAGRTFRIASGRGRILNLLMSTYDAAVQRNLDVAAARDELRRLNGQLEAKVKERTASLEEEVRERREAQEEIRRLNSGLEERVRERTAQLQAANQELEAFSYSVSHDLRAPLRHIKGYVELLTAEIGDPLSEKGREFLDTIHQASESMDQLISDLLAFFRVSRAEMRDRPIQLNALVRDAVSRLGPSVKERDIEWVIGPLPTVAGDAAALRQVFVNLLGNAVKYTRDRKPARIEVACAGEEGGRVIVSVRDNGAGFSMENAGKLFGVFQRLHRSEEFEGTGIGLALVRRIINRHGGRTWAEGEVNRGATFYLTLQPVGVPGE